MRVRLLKVLANQEQQKVAQANQERLLKSLALGEIDCPRIPWMQPVGAPKTALARVKRWVVTNHERVHDELTINLICLFAKVKPFWKFDLALIS